MLYVFGCQTTHVEKWIFNLNQHLCSVTLEGVMFICVSERMFQPKLIILILI